MRPVEASGGRLLFCEHYLRAIFTDVGAGEGVSRPGDGAGPRVGNAEQQAVDERFQVFRRNKHVDFAPFHFSGIVIAGTGRAQVEGLFLPAEHRAAAGGGG